jgi:hypothetical protein
MPEEGMYDPLHGRVDIEAAETLLGFDDAQREAVRSTALLTIIRERLEITEAEIDMQYEMMLKQVLKETRDSLGSVVRGGLDE